MNIKRTLDYIWNSIVVIGITVLTVIIPLNYLQHNKLIIEFSAILLAIKSIFILDVFYNLAKYKSVSKGSDSNYFKNGLLSYLKRWFFIDL
ncbi:MAG TPA: hypothetical protein PL041_05595, partial [Melioribacteraceae bacterium]|nr:hypothetical protein [Melioribacteraceae bacterium]